MTEPVKVALNYAEREAIDVLRKAMLDPTKAEVIAKALLKDQSKELAYNMLKQISKEMTDLLAVNRAFSDCAARLVKELPNDQSPELN